MTDFDGTNPWDAGLPGLPPEPGSSRVRLDRPLRSAQTTQPGGGPVAAVRATGLIKIYGDQQTGVRALDGIDVDFEAGCFTAIMGPSGSGKSTLMHCIAGLDTPTSGRVWLGDVEIGSLRDEALTRLRRERVGFVFQSFNLLPTLTAQQNVLLPLDLAGRTPDAAWFDYVVSTLGLTERLSHRPAELSGGQQQRVAIARALVSRPTLVVADEPTGNLDSRSGAEVLALLRGSVRELGQTVVMVTHDPIAASYADRVLLLADGRIRGQIESPTPDIVAAALTGAEPRRFR